MAGAGGCRPSHVEKGSVVVARVILFFIREEGVFIEPENLASLAVARSCGYQELELVPRHVEIGGRRRDMIRYAADRP